MAYQCGSMVWITLSRSLLLFFVFVLWQLPLGVSEAKCQNSTARCKNCEFPRYKVCHQCQSTKSDDLGDPMGRPWQYVDISAQDIQPWAVTKRYQSLNQNGSQAHPTAIGLEQNGSLALCVAKLNIYIQEANTARLTQNGVRCARVRFCTHCTSLC